MANVLPVTPNEVNYPTNLTKINVNAIEPRDVAKFFNNFFEFPIEISTNVNSAIVSFFEKIVSNKQSAQAIASAVIYTSVKQGIDPMSTLDEFKKLPENELDTYTALFLNFERIGTSYLGVKNRPTANFYINRTILP